jgi:hypothetical protein
LFSYYRNSKEEPVNKKPESISQLIVFVVITGISLIFYAILHESGHAILAILSGARINEFVIFDLRPHISYSGEISGITSRFINLAGPVFPVLVNMAFLALVPITKNFLLEAFKTCFTLITAFSIPGVVIATLLYVLGRTTDVDTISFYSMNPGVSPFAMIFIWLSVFFMMLLIMIKRANYRILPGFSSIPFRSAGPFQGHMVRIVFMSLILMTIIGIAGTWYFAEEKPASLISIDLSTISSGEVELYQFSVAQDSVTYEFSIRGLHADEFVLTVENEMTKTVLVNSKEINADIYDRPFVLKKGIHRLIVDTKNGKGILLINKKKG